MNDERPGRRAGRRVFGNPVPRSEHACLPGGSGACEAADHDLELGQRGKIGAKRSNLALRAERDERVTHAVVVSLDGKLGAIDVQRL